MRPKLIARSPARATRLSSFRSAVTYCLHTEHLRRTIPIALVVGVVLTAINQSGIILAGDATALTWVRCALNLLVPFIVSNLGLLSGEARHLRDGKAHR